MNLCKEYAYDYLIVGAGLYGAVFAREMADAGKRCLVVEKKPHVGGNVYCKKIEGINVHMYGPHIFHTNDKQIWDYVNSFTEFNSFKFAPVANYKDSIYSLPFNMHTFYQLWKVTKPQEAQAIIKKQVEDSGICNPNNFEEEAIYTLGYEVYNKLIKGYTEKQWGRRATDLPASIFKRLHTRFTYDNNYFSDQYQGIPIGGYNQLIDKLLAGVEVVINVDFLKERYELEQKAANIIFTGRIDEYFGYTFGSLEYRSLEFEHVLLDEENYQGNAVVNYTDADVPYTRIIEHKHFEHVTGEKTVITREYPRAWTRNMDSFYPINDSGNNRKYYKYKELADRNPHIVFGGRLGKYRYYDMHQIIASALKKTRLLKVH